MKSILFIIIIVSTLVYCVLHMDIEGKGAIHVDNAIQKSLK